MKKEYIRPLVKAHQVESSTIICGSGGRDAEIQSLEDEDDYEQIPEETKPLLEHINGFTGLWGE